MADRVGPHSPREVFVLADGPPDNLGDAVLRRHGVAWARALGHANVYVADADEDWVEALRLEPTDALVRRADRGRWYWRLLVQDRRPTLVFEPGEHSVATRFILHELKWLAAVALVRLRGGVVVRPPRAVRGVSRVGLWIHRLACRLSTVTLWRSERSRELMRVGRIAPDLAFGETFEGASGSRRAYLALSLRSDSPFPTDEWIEAVSLLARERGLTVVTVAQVRQDEPLAARLNARFDSVGAIHSPFAGQSLSEREAEVMAIYQRSALLVSNRLHVLVLGACAGAVPACAASSVSPKCSETFATIGYRGIELECDGLNASTIRDFLDQQLGRSEELLDAIHSGQASLDRELSMLTTASGASPRRGETSAIGTDAI